MFQIRFSEPADTAFAELRDDPSRAKRYRAVQKALRLLENNPRHPGLNTHEWRGRTCPHGDTLFEAYAENNTPGAYRVFFCYAPNQRGAILIVAITPHP